MENSFVNYVRAGYSILYIKTHEENRVLGDFIKQLSETKIRGSATQKYKCFIWDVVTGIRATSTTNGFSLGQPMEGTNADPMAPLKYLEEQAEEDSVIFLKDYHPFLAKEFDMSTLIIRKIRNLAHLFKSQGKVLVFVGPEMKIPVELEKEINVINFNLPEKEDLERVLQGLVESNGVKMPKAADLDPLLDAALGMTTVEAENAFSVSLIEAKKFDEKIVRREKSQIIKKTGMLEVIEATETLEDIGGLENVKSWLVARKKCFTPEAKAFGVKPPKGVLFLGVPGGGKSLVCKATASILQRPLLRLDMGRVFGSYVGESEGNMEQVLKMAETVSPCILWIDEIEKGLSGNKAGHEGHETTRRVFQMLLTWLQEKKKDVILLATANSIDSLPPELIRPGRIDVSFYVDLPDAVQREEMFKIHLRKAGRDVNLFNADMVQLMRACDGFTGAEIEVWVKESVTQAFSLDHPEISVEDLMTTVRDITPISKLMKAEIDANRQKAKDRGMKLASATHDTVNLNPSTTRVINMDSGLPEVSPN